MPMRLPRLPSLRPILAPARAAAFTPSIKQSRTFLTSLPRTVAPSTSAKAGTNGAARTDMMTGEVIGSADIDVSQDEKVEECATGRRPR